MTRRRRLGRPNSVVLGSFLGLGGVAAVVGIVLALVFLPDEAVVDVEARYDGVHLCSPRQQATATAAAAAAPSPTVTAIATATATAAAPAAVPPGGTAPPPPLPLPGRLGDEGSEPPYFAQNSPRWRSVEYDHAIAQNNVGCNGPYIANCGCAMTSVATILALFGVLATPGGQEPMNPQTLNDWFNGDATLTNGGWVSRGYSHGNVMWTAANTFSAEVAARAGTRTVRLKGWGSGSEDEIRRELAAGNPVILEVPGHFIAAVGVDPATGAIQINDPYYRDRTTLDAYAGKVRGSRLFEASGDLSALVVSVPSNLRVQVTDGQGRVTGTLEGGAPEEVAGQADEEIPGSSYNFEEAWRDPTCTERPPQPGDGTNTVFILSPEEQTFQVEVVNPEGGETTVAMYAYDEDGNLTLKTHDAPGDQDFQYKYDPRPGGISGVLGEGPREPGADNEPPGQVTGLDAGPGAGSGELILRWNASKEPDVDHYKIYRARTQGGRYEFIASVENEQVGWEPAGIRSYVVYPAFEEACYVVTAVDAAGNEGPPSAEVCGSAEGPITHPPTATPTPTRRGPLRATPTPTPTRRGPPRATPTPTRRRPPRATPTPTLIPPAIRPTPTPDRVPPVITGVSQVSGRIWDDPGCKPNPPLVTRVSATVKDPSGVRLVELRAVIQTQEGTLLQQLPVVTMGLVRGQDRLGGGVYAGGLDPPDLDRHGLQVVDLVYTVQAEDRAGNREVSPRNRVLVDVCFAGPD